MARDPAARPDLVHAKRFLAAAGAAPRRHAGFPQRPIGRWCCSAQTGSDQPAPGAGGQSTAATTRRFFARQSRRHAAHSGTDGAYSRHRSANLDSERSSAGSLKRARSRACIRAAFSREARSGHSRSSIIRVSSCSPQCSPARHRRWRSRTTAFQRFTVLDLDYRPMFWADAPRPGSRCSGPAECHRGRGQPRRGRGRVRRVRSRSARPMPCWTPAWSWPS